MTEFRPLETRNSGVRDKLRLFTIATIVCVGGVSCFLLAQQYRIDPQFVFAMLGVVLLVAIVRDKYPEVFRRYGLLVFLGLWALLHGLLTVFLITRHVAITYWLPVFVAEFIVGFSVLRHRLRP